MPEGSGGITEARFLFQRAVANMEIATVKWISHINSDPYFPLIETSRAAVDLTTCALISGCRNNIIIHATLADVLFFNGSSKDAIAHYEASERLLQNSSDVTMTQALEDEYYEELRRRKAIAKMNNGLDDPINLELFVKWAARISARDRAAWHFTLYGTPYSVVH
jgi:hypothetical protein